MTVWVIVLVLVAAVVLARLTRPRAGTRRVRTPKPGEGMRRREFLAANPPGDDMVAVRRAVPAGEAHVLLGYLESAGIKAGMTATRGHVPRANHTPRAYDVHVAADQAADARALLAEADG